MAYVGYNPPPQKKNFLLASLAVIFVPPLKLWRRPCALCFSDGVGQTNNTPKKSSSRFLFTVYSEKLCVYNLKAFHFVGACQKQRPRTVTFYFSNKASCFIFIWRHVAGHDLRMALSYHI